MSQISTHNKSQRYKSQTQRVESLTVQLFPTLQKLLNPKPGVHTEELIAL